MFFALATNVIVSSMLILGGSATVTDLTGMNTLAACFLIPVSVVIYVLVGGMRSTLLADYTHTTVLFCIIFTFMFTVYAKSDKIGSPTKMWELLVQAAESSPVAANAHGSYLTMRSKNGLIFGVINVIGNFATVYNDQAYWQRAVASRPATAVKGFMLGGAAWFAIPFGFATTMGLSAVALSNSPEFPTFPNKLTAAEVSAGLAAPSAAAALLGKSGAGLILVLLFLAVTSAASAELIAVSSIFTYDIYVPYFNPQATEKQRMFASHISIIGYGIIMGFLGLIFYYIGISMGWLYEFMGTVLGSAVPGIALAIMSSRANKWGCLGGAVIGLGCGIIAWLVTAATLNGGQLTVDTTGQDYPMLAGNLASIGVGCIISVGATYLWPEDFDFESTRKMKMAVTVTPPSVVKKQEDDIEETKEGSVDEKEKDSPDSPIVGADVLAAELVDADLDPPSLEKAYKWAVWASVILFVLLIIVIPLPLFFSSHVYNKGDFTTWVVVAFIWAFIGSFIVVIYPVFESRQALAQISHGIIKDVFTGGKGKKKTHAEGEAVPA